MSHDRLQCNSFTAFANPISFEFSPSVNVLIGANGTGKTHLMKLLYTWQLFRADPRGEAFGAFLGGVFQTDDATQLISGSRIGTAHVTGSFEKASWGFTIDRQSGVVPPRAEALHPGRSARIPVFLPAIDMMGHSKGFVADYDTRKIDFDLTQRNVLQLLSRPEYRRLPREHQQLISELEDRIGGKVRLEADRFYLETSAGQFPMPLVAEGHRKLATLAQLARVGALEQGTTLFWDEPETNVNPVLMDELIEAALSIARSGVQVFLATHSYIILEELSLQGRAGEVRYFLLDRNLPEGVVQKEDLRDLPKNPILQQYESVLNRKLERAAAGSTGRG